MSSILFCSVEKSNSYISMSTCPRRGQLERCLKVFLIRFNISSSLTGVCVCVCMREREREHLLLPRWQLLIKSVELRKKISHSNQSVLGLCHISLSSVSLHYTSTLDSLHSGGQILKVERNSPHIPQYRTP